MVDRLVLPGAKEHESLGEQVQIFVIIPGIMGVRIGRSISALTIQSHSIIAIKILCILLTIFQKSNLVICGDQDDESLKKALEFVERRQRDLQLKDTDYYGQPEDIGYGYQKNMGIFEDGPAQILGGRDYDPENENNLRNILYSYVNYQKDSGSDTAYNKRKSDFRERYAEIGNLLSQKENDNQQSGSDIRCSYSRALKDLWCRYRQSRQDDVNIEDLTPDQVVEILNTLNDKDEDSDDYESSVLNENEPYEPINLRSRRNYRVFDHLNEKRYPSFGEGFYGKRSPSQHINYETPSESEFLYALKFVNPDMNREAVENLKDSGYEVLGDEKDKDVMRILNDAVNNPQPGQAEEAFWLKKEEPYDEVWLSGPVAYSSDDVYQNIYNSDKRTAPKIFKQHNGIHLNNKRIPVKRSSIRSKKETKSDEKVTKELKGIFDGHQATTGPPKKKTSPKKPTEILKKQNSTKPEVTKHRDVKKLVRRANDYTKEQIYPVTNNNEIDQLFNVQKMDKKSIDWSQYFGFDKRSQLWLKNDSIRRAENLFLSPKSKRYMAHERANAGNNHFLDKSQFELPFDTRVFSNKKKFKYNMDKSIDSMEKKLGNIEEKIIDDAVKYTGAHTGESNDDMSTVKKEIVHHLEAAYSLEKMKNALEEFKNSMKSEKEFQENMKPKNMGTDTPKFETQATTVRAETQNLDNEKSKRISAKKEIEDVYRKDNLEYLNWSPSKDSDFSNKNDNTEECPVLDRSLNNCLRVGEILGKFSELLLPICSLHQICYTCGSEIGFSRPSACDLMYLTEAENLCQGNRGCLIGARDSMLALRDIHEQEMTSQENSQGSCLFSPCLQKYFMNTPAAVVPLEMQD